MTVLRTDAYLKFKECILSGSLRPGQFVTQREMCELIDVPIAPAREAIQRLEHETLLKVYPKRGIQIADVSPRLIRNAYQLRTMIEKEALFEFISNAHPDEIQELHDNSLAALQYAEENGLTEETVKRLTGQDEAFHGALVNSLDNDLISQTYLINQARIVLIRLGNRDTENQIIPAMHEHMEILKSCLEREFSRASQLLVQHLRSSQRRAMDGC